jgi:hypothetical protein
MILSRPTRTAVSPYFLRMLTGRAYDKSERCRAGGIPIRVAYQLPADLIDERQARMKDDDIDVGEVCCSPIHTGLRAFDRLRARRDTLMHATGGHAQFKGFCKDGRRDMWIVYTPGERFPIAVTYVIESFNALT